MTCLRPRLRLEPGTFRTSVVELITAQVCSSLFALKLGGGGEENKNNKQSKSRDARKSPRVFSARSLKNRPLQLPKMVRSLKFRI